MNETPQSRTTDKKSSAFRPLAIISFIGIIILVAWLSIKIVNIAPSTFSSLASLAESLNQKGSSSDDSELDTFTVSSNTPLLNAGNDTTISWESTDQAGSYTFSYGCTEGVAVDILNIDGLQSITCNTKYNIGDINSLAISIDSERSRYADLKYTIDFLATNDTKPRASGSSSLAIVNSEISSVLKLNTETSVEVNEEPVIEAEVAAKPAPVIETAPETVVTTTPAPTLTQREPVYTQEFIYTIPVSDPNGRTDLSTRYLNIGTIVGNTFFPGAVKEKGAIQFEVKNYGTKTSAEWDFKVSLPDGSTYTSKEQAPLKPNERAVLTVGFNTVGSMKHTFVVIVDESTDTNSLNDGFKQAVTFTK